ncbi:SDR family NAD(P)-dependent oxidoreductase [Lichenicoccus roseus]|uniref:SDR family NAD(P)-dependent oxidoreductase n=1 Tax=Lichenicoccus roseus TaxID=2683649 RepID=A0A5R9IZE1_9PROT|nr:SDR family NAD(P)-dependent oxidoreductase [Lichenicoccus roseus]TLU70825.1 SDR family NAD(P)-dependent oxidoreductase [Lichenicoccus roseus]
MTESNLFSLADKIAVVTGAARGIGRAAAVAMARAGADVVGIDIAGSASVHVDFASASVEDLAETGRQVEAAGRRWKAITLDQRDRPALRAAAAAVKAELGGVDILFANGGIQAFKPILEMEDPDWDDQIDINLTGTMNAVRAFAPLLVERGGGRIIVTSSTQGQHGTKNGSAYSASKWGIIGLMKSAAMELGEHGITVNALIPGLIDTVLTRHEDRYAQALQTAGKQPSGDVAKDEAAAREALTAKSPLGVPWISAEDVAPMVVFLASDAARMASGATYSVTAGDSANGSA